MSLHFEYVLICITYHTAIQKYIDHKEHQFLASITKDKDREKKDKEKAWAYVHAQWCV